jgi:pilus assembly protein CpaE
MPAGMVGGLTPMGAMSLGITRGKVIVVYSPKGGTGTTTIAVNLALTLHNEDTRAVIVDANLQYGDVAVFFNEQGKNTIADLAPRVEELDHEIVEDVLIKHQASGVHILAAPSRPEHGEKIASSQFLKIIEFLRQMYAYVVIDTSSYLSEVVIAAIDASDVIVLICTQDIPAIKNTRLYLDLLQTLGTDRERIVFCMNRFDKRIAITPERVSENLKQEVAAVLPLDDRIVIPAVNRGVPFMLDQKTQPIARAMYGLATSVRTRLTALESEDMERAAKR